MVEHKQVLTTEEAADYLGFEVSTLKNWRYQDEGPRYIRTGDGPRGGIRYLLEDLNDWLDDRRVTPSKKSTDKGGQNENN